MFNLKVLGETKQSWQRVSRGNIIYNFRHPTAAYVELSCLPFTSPRFKVSYGLLHFSLIKKGLSDLLFCKSKLRSAVVAEKNLINIFLYRHGHKYEDCIHVYRIRALSEGG